MFVVRFPISEHAGRISVSSDYSKHNDVVERELQLQEQSEMAAQKASKPQDDPAKLSHFGSVRMLHSLPTGQLYLFFMRVLFCQFFSFILKYSNRSGL